MDASKLGQILANDALLRKAFLAKKNNLTPPPPPASWGL